MFGTLELELELVVGCFELAASLRTQPIVKLFVFSTTFRAGDRKLSSEYPDSCKKKPDPKYDKYRHHRGGVHSREKTVDDKRDHGCKHRCDDYAISSRGGALVHHAAVLKRFAVQ